MDHFSKKDMLKITGKWLVIFGTIMIIFCAYQYRLGSMYTSRMISLVGSLEHQTDVETAIFGELHEEDYQKGLQRMQDLKRQVRITFTRRLYLMVEIGML